MPTVTIYATKQASVNEVDPTQNYSGNDYLNVGDDYFVGGQNYHSWLGFDLSALAGKQIDDAVLYIHPFFAGSFSYAGGSLNVQKCTDNSWTEAGITWNNAPNASVGIEKFGISVTGSDTVKTFTVTGQVQDSVASGGITYRVKPSVEDGDTEAYLSSSVYSATVGAKLVVTYDDTATVEGFIDVPTTEDGYIYGTYDGSSTGITVFKTGNTILFGMSSSTGVDVDQMFLMWDTSTANLTSLGLPAGATITSHAWRVYVSEAEQGPTGISYAYWRAWAGELGDTIDLTDWDAPGMSTPGNRTFNSVGWTEHPLVSINSSGISAIAIVPANCNSTSHYVTVHSSRNSSGNAPVLRIYYSYTPSTTRPKQFSLAPDLIRFGSEDNNKLIRL
jgi:hypothetical protein